MPLGGYRGLCLFSVNCYLFALNKGYSSLNIIDPINRAESVLCLVA